jgi:hypothetical protein
MVWFKKNNALTLPIEIDCLSQETLEISTSMVPYVERNNSDESLEFFICSRVALSGRISQTASVANEKASQLGVGTSCGGVYDTSSIESGLS